MWSHAELTSTAGSILHAAFVRSAASGNTFITFRANRVSDNVDELRRRRPSRAAPTATFCWRTTSAAERSPSRSTAGRATVFGPAACPNGANGTFASSSAMNNGQINAGLDHELPLNDGHESARRNHRRRLFGEAQIDVSSVLGSMGITGCYSYVQAQAHTRSSSSISSALIDNVKPLATREIANCGCHRHGVQRRQQPTACAGCRRGPGWPAGPSGSMPTATASSTPASAPRRPTPRATTHNDTPYTSGTYHRPRGRCPPATPAATPGELAPTARPSPPPARTTVQNDFGLFLPSHGVRHHLRRRQRQRLHATAGENLPVAGPHDLQ